MKFEGLLQWWMQQVVLLESPQRRGRWQDRGLWVGSLLEKQDEEWQVLGSCQAKGRVQDREVRGEVQAQIQVQVHIVV